jgi:hypothetical protein
MDNNTLTADPVGVWGITVGPGELLIPRGKAKVKGKAWVEGKMR